MSQSSNSSGAIKSPSQTIAKHVAPAIEEETSRLLEIVNQTRQHLESLDHADQPHGYYVRTVCDLVSTYFEQRQAKVQERSIYTEAFSAKNDHLATDAKPTSYVSRKCQSVSENTTQDELNEVLGVFQDEAERVCREELNRRSGGRSLIRVDRDDPLASQWPDLRENLDGILTKVYEYHKERMSHS